MSAQSPAALDVLRHLSRAFLVSLGFPGHPAGPGAEPWCAFLERCSRRMCREMRSVIVPLLSAFVERADGLTPEGRRLAGAAARRVLEFAWGHEPRDRGAVLTGIVAVCRSYMSAPAESAELLRRCLRREHLEAHGHEEMPRLADELGRLVPIDPSFVEEVYWAVFAHEETSEDETHLGSGRILPMRSNRRQDYRGALYQLTKAYREFLEQAPLPATRALIAAVGSYVERTSAVDPREIPTDAIEVDGRPAQVASDCSCMWDGMSTSRTDPVPRMLDEFERRLRRLSDGEDGAAVRAQILDCLIAENRFAAVWRRVLTCATAAPRTLGREVRSLAWSVPILTGIDFESIAGPFLAAIFPTLPADERQKVEEAILSLPESAQAEDREDAEAECDGLLRWVPAADLVTEPAKRRAGQLAAPRTPPAPQGDPDDVVVGADFTEEAMLAEQGVPVDAEANRRLREVAAPVKAFAGRHLTSAPTAEEAQALLPSLQALRDAMSSADGDGVHPAQKDAAWCDLAAACACLPRAGWFSCEAPVGELVREVLLEAAGHDLPRPRPAEEAEFAERLVWKHAPRGDAAEGLVRMCDKATCLNPGVLAAVERLSRDPAALVRSRVAENLLHLYRRAPDTMWGILEGLGRAEPNLLVLLKALTSIRGLARRHPEKFAPVIRDVFARTQAAPEGVKVRCACLDLCIRVSPGGGDPYGGEIIARVLADVARHSEEAEHLVKVVAPRLVAGPVQPPNPEEDERRRQAFGLVERVARAAVAAFRSLRERHDGSVPAAEQQTLEGILKVGHALAQWAYFISGAHEERQPEDKPGRRRLDPAVRRRFLQEAGPLLDLIAEIPHPEVIHNLLQTLETYVPLDPQGVFLRVGRVVRAGQTGGYEYEAMGADLVVRLVRRYLAEYRTLFRDHRDCLQTLMDLLNTFIRAGWARALRLTYRLEELFR